MALDGMIFDVDGTLVDSNDFHVEAWHRALNDHGYEVAPDRIAVEVGKGGDNLVPDLLGKGADARDGKALRKAEGQVFAALARGRGVQAFPRAAEMIRAVRGRGIRTVIATSGGRANLEVMAELTGVDWEKEVDAVVTADDAARSKPAPDLVSAAADKLGLSPAQCAMVGDTQWDAQSCLRAGVVCVGVKCGGRDESTLLKAGARLVFAGPGDLVDHLDEALRRCSPAKIKLTSGVMESLMRAALEVARDGAAHGEAPIGCVIADAQGIVVARGYNSLNKTKNKTAHAEMVAFADAAGKVPVEANDLILVSTLEPCVMCTGAAMEAAIDTIVYALKAPPDAGTRRVTPPQSPESQMPRIVGGVLADESRQLFETWLKGREESQQTKYVRQLLASVE